MSRIRRVIGIDFGTSTTYMNVKNYSVTQNADGTEKPNPVGGKTIYMPVEFNFGASCGFVLSIVRENPDGSFDFGEKASEEIDGATIYREVKMQLESSDEQVRGNARRITKEFFKYLYNTYKQQEVAFGNYDEEKTIISYPVKWKPETACFMIEAAKQAGFANVCGMDEAEAAMTTMLCQNSEHQSYVSSDKPGYLMLIDMGAGTTDLVVCKYQPNSDGKLEITPINSWPCDEDAPTFGGREIDFVLEEYVENYLKSSLNPDYAAMVHSLPGQAKSWKERNVSWALGLDKRVDTCAYLSAYRNLGILTAAFPAFGKTEFEEMSSAKLTDYATLVKGCLDDAVSLDSDLAEHGLDIVILTGGHSTWYFASQMIDGTMKGWIEHPALKLVREKSKRVFTMPTPQITVSLGLVYSEQFQVIPSFPPKFEDSEPRISPAEARAIAYKDMGFTEPKINLKCELGKVDSVSSYNIEIIAGSEKYIYVIKATNGEITSKKIERYPGNKIRMVINDISYIAGRGNIFTGIIERGCIRVGDELASIHSNQEFYGKMFGNLEVLSIEKNGQLVQCAYAQDTVGLTLRSTNSAYNTAHIENGDILVDGQPGPRRWIWDDSLLNIVQEFMESNSEMSRSNEMHSRPDVLRRMMTNHGIPQDKKIYYMKDTGLVFHGKSGLIISEMGISNYVLWSLEKLPWESFLNTNVTVSEDKCVIPGLTVLRGQYDLDKLQQILRDKSREITEHYDMNKRVCSKCGAEVDGDFCGNCGTKYSVASNSKVNAPRICSKCGSVVEDAFCGICGEKYVPKEDMSL